jgi:hypothetical protein
MKIQKTLHYLIKTSTLSLIALVIAVSSITSIFVFSPNTSAQGCSEEEQDARRIFYSNNDIPFIEVCGDGGTGGVCSAGSGTLTSPPPKALQGESNPEKVWNYFIARGLTPIGAAGAMGNMVQESAAFDPWAGESGNRTISKTIQQVGFGIIQWTNTGGNAQGRRYGVMKYMEDKGVSLDATNKSQGDKALLEQLNWLWDGEYGKMTWQKEVNAEKKVEGDPSKNFQENNTGNGSAMVFHKLVERSGDGTSGKQERIDSAKDFLKKFGNGSQGCSSAEGGLTEEQAKKLMMNYGENKGNDSIKAMNSGPGKPGTGCNGGPLSNCVSFSAFFMNKFTNLKYRGGNGNEVVGNLGAAGAKTGNQPRLFAVFSNGFARDAGHTGIVLGIEGTKLIVGHASCGGPGSGRGDGTSDGGGAGFIKVGTIDTGALIYTDKPKFAYPDNVDTKAIQAYIGG